MSKDSLTQETLKQYLEYDPETGDFTWLVNRGRCKPGDVAGTVGVFGYVHIGFCGYKYYAHRLVFLYMEGRFPEREVDHRNHDRSDNRWVNLRHATRKTNSRNLSAHSNNTSGVTGVGRDELNNKWMAYITVNRKMINLGRREDINDAIALRKAAEKKYGFHRNHGALAA